MHHKHKGNDNDKAKDFMGSLLKLLVYNKKYIPYILIAIIFSFGSSVLSILGPDKLKEITNLIFEGLQLGIDTDKIKKLAIILAIFYVSSFVLNYLQSIIMALVTNYSSQKMRSAIAKKINLVPLSYFDNTSIGDILSRVTNDVDTIGHTLSDSVSGLVTSITMLIGTLIMMFTTNYIMAITAILSSIIGFLFMGVILKSSQKYFNAFQSGLGDLNGHIEEIYSGHNVVRVNNAREEANQKFDLINGELRKNANKSQFLSGLMMPLMGFTGNLGYVLVCVVGAILVIKGKTDFGVIVAFMLYVRLFTNPLSQIAQSSNALQQTAAASERVFEFLDTKNMNPDSKINHDLDVTKVKGNIEFQNVKFGYNEDKVIIKDFSCKVKDGQKIAIVGPTGAGKTTLVNLLMRFYEINEGNIFIDGIKISDIPKYKLRELFVMVLQDTWLFEGTIKENILFNTKNVKDEDVINACKTVGLHHFVKTLPNGYDTMLGDTESLSAGQKQLLTIARGMIKNAPFLILDEATSNVDTRTEELVQKAMDKLSKGKTSFIIAHRLSTIKNADLILVLKDGDIVEMGNHEDLLKKKGFYADLYNSQFQKDFSN